LEFRRVLFRSRSTPCVACAPSLDNLASRTFGPPRPRRGGRVVDCTALEMRHTGNRIGGSNPSLSATTKKFAQLRYFFASLIRSTFAVARRHPTLSPLAGRGRRCAVTILRDA